MYYLDAPELACLRRNVCRRARLALLPGDKLEKPPRPESIRIHFLRSLTIC